jgi:hypothetical protein
MTFKELSGKVVANLAHAGDGARNGATSAYDTVMNHPKSTAAVVLGTGAAAALWWVLRRPERVEALRKQIAKRTHKRRTARSRHAAA